MYVFTHDGNCARISLERPRNPEVSSTGICIPLWSFLDDQISRPNHMLLAANLGFSFCVCSRLPKQFRRQSEWLFLLCHEVIFHCAQRGILCRNREPHSYPVPTSPIFIFVTRCYGTRRCSCRACAQPRKDSCRGTRDHYC